MSDPTEIITLESLQEYQDTASKHRLLQSHYDDISQMGCVSREQARQLVEIAGENILNGRPINSFTAYASKTNYDAAMEGIVAKLSHFAWEAIRTAAKFLLELLKDVINLLLERAGLRQTPEKAAAETQALNDFRESVEPMTTPVVDTHPKVTGEVSKLDSIATKFDTSYTVLTHDLLTVGRYGQLATHLEFFLLEKIDAVTAMCELYESVMEEFKRGPDYIERNKDKLTSSLNAILKPMNVNPLPTLVKKTGFQFNHISSSSTYFEIVRACAEHYSDAKVAPYGDKALTVQEATKLVAEKRVVENCPKIVNNKQSVKQLEKCKDSLRAVQDALTSIELPDGLSDLAVEAWGVLRENVTAIANTKQISEGLFSEASRVSLMVREWSIQNGKILKIEAELADPGNHDAVQAEMRKLQSKLG